MSTINVNNILAAYSPQGVVNLNGTNVSYNPDTTVIGIGLGALQICTGNNSVALGRQALSNVTTGGDNTGVGGGALGSTTGSDNTAIGFFAGATHTTGSNNTFVGHSALGSSITANNEITLGNSANTILRCAVATITSLSDARDKKDVTELRTGLDFINKLKPVEFVWNDREEKGKHDVADFGFIAQELKSAQEEVGMADILKLVYEENPEKLEASYGKLIPILVKAIQDLSKEVELLKK